MTVKVYYIERPLVEYMWWKTPSLHLKKSHDTEHFITLVSRIYAPPFATLALVENVGGAYMRDLTFLSREYAPTSGATPRC